MTAYVTAPDQPSLTRTYEQRMSDQAALSGKAPRQIPGEPEEAYADRVRRYTITHKALDAIETASRS